MSEQTKSIQAVGAVTLQVEELGRRFILCEQIGSGELEEGRKYWVGSELGGQALLVYVDGGGRYVIPILPAIEYVLKLDAERWEREITARAEGRAS